MKKLFIVALLFSASVSWAQSPTTITGSLTDASGNPATSGYVEFDLQPLSPAIPYSVPGVVSLVPQTARCGINATGQLKNNALSGPCTVWSNSLIVPANSLYTIIEAPLNVVATQISSVLIPQTATDLSNLTIIQPRPVIGTIVNASPLSAMSVVPSQDSVWSLGQPNLKWANIFANNLTLTNPLTFSSFNAINLKTGVFNGIYVVDDINYTTVAAAVAAAGAQPNGGVVWVPPTHPTETFTTQIDLGSSTAPVVLVLWPGSHLICNVQDITKNCFNAHNAGGIVGFNVGANGTAGGGAVIELAATAQVKAVVDTPEGQVGQPGQAFLSLSDLTFKGNPAAICSEIINLEGISDINVIQNIHIDNFPCKGIRMASNASNVAGPFVLVNPEINGVYIAGSIPISIEANGKSNGGVQILGGNVVHPGAGQPIININGGGVSGLLSGIKIATYLENLKNGGSAIIKIVDATEVSYEPPSQSKLCGNVNDGQCNGTPDTLIDVSETGAARTCNITATTYSVNSANNAAPAILNHISSPAESISGVNGTWYFGGETGCSVKPFAISANSLNIKDLLGNTNWNLTNTALTYKPGVDASQTWAINMGATVPEQWCQIVQQLGVSKWETCFDASNNYFVTDLTNTKTRIIFPQSASSAGTGQIRFANAELMGWRNAANSGDLTAGYNASNVFAMTGGSQVGTNGIPVTIHEHKRVTTGVIGATTRTEVLLSWTNSFGDTNYTATCNVEDSTTAAGTQGLTFERLRTKSATQVGAVINNPTAGGITGTLDCVGDHD